MHRITWGGALFTCFYFLIFFSLVKKVQPTFIKIISHLLLIITTVGLFTHKISGFFNLKIIDSIQLASDSRSFSLFLNFDKPLFAVGYLYFFYKSNKKQQNAGINRLIFYSLFCWIVCCTFLFGSSTLLSYARFDPKFPNEAWVWIFSNLILTCIAEECFFRGYIQKYFCDQLDQTRYGKWVGLVITSILFGFAHFTGGIAYVFLATVAGLFYGYAYQRTQKIEAAILTHFGVNAVHFFFFSYPALIR
jgi:membrane protease YdiL (CAAX protease family)